MPVSGAVTKTGVGLGSALGPAVGAHAASASAVTARIENFEVALESFRKAFMSSFYD
jgi:hypothetical protein